MGIYICTKCLTRCYMVDTSDMKDPDNKLEPNICPYGSVANWNETTLADMMKYLEV